MRADARRNRERLLAAARDVFVAQGPDAPLDAISTAAEVGIGTLYRRFPDRRALFRAVVLDVLARTAEEARLALDEEEDAFRALARYLHRALDLRVSAVMPALLDHIPPDDEEIASIRTRSWGLFQQLVDRAHAAGTLRRDATFADIGFLLVRLARPLPGPIPRDLDNRLAHRHLELLLDGLRTDRAEPATPLPEPALTLADLLAGGASWPGRVVTAATHPSRRRRRRAGRIVGHGEDGNPCEKNQSRVSISGPVPRGR